MIDWLIVFISINATPKYVYWGLGCRLNPKGTSFFDLHRRLKRAF